MKFRLESLSWLFAPSGEGLSFAMRCCLSVALGLWLAFYMELENAYWVFINIAILIRPLPGFLVVRSVARLLGTLVAASMSMLLIALFAQSYTLYATGLVLWVATMVFCANHFRLNMSYGFVLAGYVTAIISVRTMANPDTIFSIAMARTAETTVAAFVTALISVLTMPGLASKQYFQARMAALKAMGRQYRGLEQSAAADSGAADPKASQQLHSLVTQTLTLEQKRQYARFGDPAFVDYDRLARRLDYELLSIVSAMASLQLYLERLGETVDSAPLAKLRQAADLLAADPKNIRGIKQAFGQAYQEILSQEQTCSARDYHERSLADWVVLSRSLVLANRLHASLVKHGLLIHESHPGGSESARHRDFVPPASITESLNVAVRAAVAMGTGALLWVTHHDQSALQGTMTLLAVITTLFALSDKPALGARGFGLGAFCAGMAAFIVNFLILPQITNYAMLMLAIMPVVFIAGLAMINPTTQVVGRIGLVIFALLVHPANNSRQDFVSFFESFLGVELAVVLAWLAFTVVLPVNPRVLLRKRLDGIFADLARHLGGSRARFETRVYDRLAQLPLAADQGEFHVSARQAAFAAINMGVEEHSLRLLARRARFSTDSQKAIKDLQVALKALFQNGYPAIDSVADLQWQAHHLAHDLLTEALALSQYRRRRYGVRAAVSAELLAAALADYVQSREAGDRVDIQLGEVGST